MLFFQASNFLDNRFKPSNPVPVILVDLSWSISFDLVVRFFRNSLSFYKGYVQVDLLDEMDFFLFALA